MGLRAGKATLALVGACAESSEGSLEAAAETKGQDGVYSVALQVELAHIAQTERRWRERVAGGPQFWHTEGPFPPHSPARLPHIALTPVGNRGKRIGLVCGRCRAFSAVGVRVCVRVCVLRCA